MMRIKTIFLIILIILMIIATVGFFEKAQAQTLAGPENVLVVMNKNLPESKKIGEYYQNQRGIPQENMIYLNLPWTAADNHISYSSFEERIKTPIKQYFEYAGLKAQILYIVMTYGIPYTIEDVDNKIKSLV